MQRPATMTLVLAVLAAIAAIAPMRVSAESGTFAPRPPRGKGDHCVADTDFMRRNHMSLLLHHRVEAVRRGVHTPLLGLNDCITCHAVTGLDGKPVSFESPQHFCRSCHDYAAVSIDCFECHASRPDESGRRAAVQTFNNEVAAIDQYLRDSKQ